MRRYKRFPPKLLEIISIIIALIIALIVNDRTNREEMGSILCIITLLIGTIFAFIAYKMQWQSIRECEKRR